MKVDAAGRRLWTHQLGAYGTEAYSVAVDDAGNAYVVGETLGDLDGNSSAGGSDLFVVKYDAAGRILWTRQLGSAGFDVASAVAADHAGNVYVAGRTDGALDGNPSAGGNDAFLMKFDPAGARLWTRQIGSSAADLARSVATDVAGSVFVVGQTRAGLGENTSAGANDVFVVKFDSSGTRVWTRQLGSASEDNAYSVAMDGSGSMYVAGQTFGSLDGKPSEGHGEGFLMKLDASGGRLWVRQLGSSGDDIVRGVATNAAGDAFVTGTTGSTPSDAFLVKFSPDGRQR